jgi:hypothetical protein
MKSINISFIKTDNEVLINENCIRWVKKMNECLEICIKSNGCYGEVDTHKICKVKNLANFKKFDNFFE